MKMMSIGATKIKNPSQIVMARNSIIPIHYTEC